MESAFYADESRKDAVEGVGSILTLHAWSVVR